MFGRFLNRKPNPERIETVEEATRKAGARMARPDSARDLREAREWAAMIAEMQAQAEAGTLSEIGQRLLDAHLRLDAL
jgi:hypothetical protein